MAFEDFPVGHTFRTGSLTLTEDDILGFARDWDPQPFHIDHVAAAESVFGGIIASGFHTILIAFRLSLRDGGWSDCSMGSPGMADIRWLRPVRPGDSLRVVATVTEARASASRPDRGFVTIAHEVLTQDDTLVASYTATHMLARRAAG